MNLDNVYSENDKFNKQVNHWFNNTLQIKMN